MSRPGIREALEIGPPLPPPRAVRVLMVEDSASDVAYVKRALSSGRNYYEVIDTASLLGALKLVKQECFDLILLDLNLFDIGGLVSVLALRAEVPHLPIIVYSGIDDARLRDRAMRYGAHSYLVKGQEAVDALDGILDRALDAPAR